MQFPRKPHSEPLPETKVCSGYGGKFQQAAASAGMGWKEYHGEARCGRRGEGHAALAAQAQEGLEAASAPTKGTSSGSTEARALFGSEDCSTAPAARPGSRSASSGDADLSAHAHRPKSQRQVKEQRRVDLLGGWPLPFSGAAAQVDVPAGPSVFARQRAATPPKTSPAATPPTTSPASQSAVLQSLMDDADVPAAARPDATAAATVQDAHTHDAPSTARAAGTHSSATRPARDIKRCRLAFRLVLTLHLVFTAELFRVQHLGF